MSGPGGADDAPQRAYREALARHATRDVQPLYRKLLVRLKSKDPEAYEAAVARYGQEVEPRASSGEEDPLAVWIEYGLWLADQLEPGDPLAVDPTGRAELVREPPPPLGVLIVHIPEGDKAKAIPLAIPEEPTGPQQATVEILCE